MTDHYSHHTDEVSQRLEEKDYFPALSRWGMRHLTNQEKHARMRAHLQPRRTMTNYEADYEYTDSFNAWRSSALLGAWFNADESSVAVALRESREVYVYDDFTETDWNNFKNALSAGRFYAKTIKRGFGPGEKLGDFDSLEFARASVPAPDMSSVGLPKDLVYSEDAVVDGVPVKETTNVYNLTVTPPAPVGEKFDHEVVFTVDDGSEKTYKTRAGSVTEAVEALEQVGDMLDLTFKVKRVVVHFE